MDPIDAIRRAAAAVEERRVKPEVRSVGAIRNLAYSYDKARFAALGQGVLQVWRAAPFAWERTFLLPSGDHGAGIAFSRDGAWIAVSDRRLIWRCDLATGEIAAFCDKSRGLEGDPERLERMDEATGEDALGFAEDGRLVQVDEYGEVRAWDPAGSPVSADDLSVQSRGDGLMRAPGVAQIKGQANAEGLANPFTGYAKGPRRRMFFYSSAWGGWKARSLLSPDGRWLLVHTHTRDGQSSSSDYTWWDLTEEKRPDCLGNEDGGFVCGAMAFSPDSRLVALSFHPPCVSVFKLSSSREIVQIDAPDPDGPEELEPLEVAFWGSEALTIVWGSELVPGRVLTYRLPSGEPIPAGDPALSRVGRVLFAAVEEYAPWRREGSRIYLWDGATQEELLAIPCPPGFTSCAPGPRGTLAIGVSEGAIELRAPGQEPRSFPVPGLAAPHHLEWGPDERWLLVVSPAGFGWYRPGGERIAQVTLPSVERVSLVPGRHLLALLSGGLILRWPLGE